MQYCGLFNRLIDKVLPQNGRPSNFILQVEIQFSTIFSNLSNAAG
jgi:hypothetical protein